MSLTISFVGLDTIIEKLTAFPSALNDALSAKSATLVEALAEKVRQNLSGDVLEQKTGLLLGSIASSTEDTADGTSASVFVSGDVPYAAIQEYGGTTKAHVIEAAKGRALAFSWAGKQSFFTHVNHPGSNIPARSYMGSALDAMQGDIIDSFADAVGEAIT